MSNPSQQKKKKKKKIEISKTKTMKIKINHNKKSVRCKPTTHIRENQNHKTTWLKGHVTLYLQTPRVLSKNW